ncbi:hypothetical protein GUJ93_ZPchr0012g21383 [Zizania palustris]|uniref:Uncharacterized protein n=1 Tax=Zizania palustris TaxID=103762 RepID=A0A8J6BTU2_ZIZPA|nr:hypothetical protein GUJ93_ZPchr0012g21383 [Zizania palustris]
MEATAAGPARATAAAGPAREAAAAGASEEDGCSEGRRLGLAASSLTPNNVCTASPENSPAGYDTQG